MLPAVRYFCDVYSNMGATVRYKRMLSCSKPVTYFGLFAAIFREVLKKEKHKIV
jgi:hypothetical protein